MQRQQVSATPAAFNWGPEGVGLRAGCAAAPTWKTLASRASRHASAITAASLPMSSKGSRARQCFTTSLASTLPQPAYCSCTATVGRAHAKLSSSTTMLLRWSRLAARHTLLAMRDTVSYLGGEMIGAGSSRGGRAACLAAYSPHRHGVRSDAGGVAVGCRQLCLLPLLHRSSPPPALLVLLVQGAASHLPGLAHAALALEEVQARRGGGGSARLPRHACHMVCAGAAGTEERARQRSASREKLMAINRELPATSRRQRCLSQARQEERYAQTNCNQVWPVRLEGTLQL